MGALAAVHLPPHHSSGVLHLDPALALEKYQEARIERTTSIVLRSSENRRRFHNSALASAAGAAAYVDREWTEAKVRERYDWLFRYNVDEVPI